jgi:transcriptional regulator GlxA family with amidase domain
MDKWNVGVLVFEGVAVLDVAGPFEVLTRARLEPGVESRRTEDGALFDVFTVAKTVEPVTATGGLVIVPRHSFADGRESISSSCRLRHRPVLQDAETSSDPPDLRPARAPPLCTGALLLARAGLLDGRRATTHRGSFGLLTSLAKDVSVDREARFVDDGVMTSAGVASGMDLALHIVETLFGRAVADETARYIEYRRG